MRSYFYLPVHYSLVVDSSNAVGEIFEEVSEQVPILFAPIYNLVEILEEPLPSKLKDEINAFLSDLTVAGCTSRQAVVGRDFGHSMKDATATWPFDKELRGKLQLPAVSTFVEVRINGNMNNLLQQLCPGP